jgi:hypothetical protein
MKPCWAAVLILLALPGRVIAQDTDEEPVPAKLVSGGGRLVVEDANCRMDAPRESWHWLHVKRATPTTYRCRGPEGRTLSLTIATGAGADLSGDFIGTFAVSVVKLEAPPGAALVVDKVESSIYPIPGSFRVAGHVSGATPGSHWFAYVVLTTNRYGVSTLAPGEVEPPEFQMAAMSFCLLKPDAAPPAVAAAVERSAHLAQLEVRDRQARIGRERSEAKARHALYGLVLVAFLPAIMMLVQVVRAAPRRVVIPFARIKDMPRACVVTGFTDELRKERVKFVVTSSLGMAVGLLSLVSLFTGGIVYRPGSKSIELDLTFSDRAKTLRRRATIFGVLSLLGTIALFAAFLATAVMVETPLVWVVPLVLALVVPGLLASQRDRYANPRCVDMTKETITLQFGSEAFAAAVRESVVAGTPGRA